MIQPNYKACLKSTETTTENTAALQNERLEAAPRIAPPLVIAKPAVVVIATVVPDPPVIVEVTPLNVPVAVLLALVEAALETMTPPEVFAVVRVAVVVVVVCDSFTKLVSCDADIELPS